MLNPGFALFLTVAVAGCSGSLRELRDQLRAKRARALQLQDECYGEQCGFCYPEENPRNWQQSQGQVSQFQQPKLPQNVFPPGFPQESLRFSLHVPQTGVEAGQTFPSQNQKYPGQVSPNQRYQAISAHNFQSQDPPGQNYPGPVGSGSPQGLPPGVNAPYCFNEDGQPRVPGISPQQTDSAHRWRSPLLTQQDDYHQLNPMQQPPFQFPGQQETFQQYPELPGAKLRKKLDSLLHPAKQPSSKYSPHLSPNYHHPKPQPPPKSVLQQPKLSSYPKLSDMMQPPDPNPKPTDLPSEWTQLPRGYNRNQQPNYDRPSTTTTPKPLSSFFRDFLPKYVETVPPPTCPISSAYQQSEQQAPALPDYEQQAHPHQQASQYDQSSDQQPSQDQSSLRRFDSSNGPQYGQRPHFAHVSYQQR